MRIRVSADVLSGSVGEGRPFGFAESFGIGVSSLLPCIVAAAVREVARGGLYVWPVAGVNFARLAVVSTKFLRELVMDS